MNQELILFLLLGAVAIITAISMLLSENAIYAAMFLVLNFVTVAILYLLLNAAFIAMVQVTVYAGAIMVLFLFVIMLLGAERAAKGRGLRWQGPLAAVMAGTLLFEFGYIILGQQRGLLPTIEAVSESFGSPASIGDLLFNRFLLPFEVTSILLLVAMVGAVLLTRGEQEEKS